MENIIFLNKKSKNMLKSAKEKFDVVITNDANFNYINKLLEKIS